MPSYTQHARVWADQLPKPNHRERKLVYRVHEVSKHKTKANSKASLTEVHKVNRNLLRPHNGHGLDGYGHRNLVVTRENAHNRWAMRERAAKSARGGALKSVKTVVEHKAT